MKKYAIEDKIGDFSINEMKLVRTELSNIVGIGWDSLWKKITNQFDDKYQYWLSVQQLLNIRDYLNRKLKKEYEVDDLLSVEFKKRFISAATAA